MIMTSLSECDCIVCSVLLPLPVPLLFDFVNVVCFSVVIIHKFLSCFLCVCPSVSLRGRLCLAVCLGLLFTINGVNLHIECAAIDSPQCI